MGHSEIILLDGGIGRELERRGMPFQQPEWSALAMMEAPGQVQAVHQDFIRSGATLITTNSYALVPFHIGEERFINQGQSLAASAGQVARAAVVESGVKARIAGSIPPLFGSYRADLYQAERAADIATPLITGLKPYVDLWLLETQSLLAESQSVIALIDELDEDKRPVWVAFTLEDADSTRTPRLRSGEEVVDAVKAMAATGVEAILFNCCQPEVIGDAIAVTREVLESIDAREIKIGAYANAFAPLPFNTLANEGIEQIRDEVTPTAYLHWAQQWHQQGATVIGGCCGIGPEHIALLSKKLA